MKRIFFIILCLIGGWMSLHAQAKYRVYSYEGKVQYKQSGKNSSLQAVKADLMLEAMDTIRVAKGSKIRIIDTQRNKIYTIEEKSNNAVYNLVKDAKNSLAKRILNSLTRSLFSAKQDTLKHTMKVLGAGSRGQGGKIDYYDMAEQLCSSAKRFGAGLDPECGISAIDWHIEFGQLKDSLAEIRTIISRIPPTTYLLRSGVPAQPQKMPLTAIMSV